MGRTLLGTPAMVRLAINGNAGADVFLDFEAITTAGGTERIIPWSRIDVTSINGQATRYAGAAGEIAGTRYFTIPAGSIMAIEGPSSISRLYFRSDAAGADTLSIAIYR